MRRNFLGIAYDFVTYRGHPQLAAMRGPRMGNPRETDPREGNPVYNAAYLRVQKGSVDDMFDAGAQVGGLMQSGIGRELSKFGLANYAEVKPVTVKLKPK
jgi:hypothetical protein